MSETDRVRAAREAFGRTLRDLRRDANLSGRELAAATGFADYKISRLERARTSPSEEEIRVWARACGAENRIPELIASHRAVDEMWEEHHKAFRTGGIGQRSERVKPLYERTKLIRAYETVFPMSREDEAMGKHAPPCTPCKGTGKATINLDNQEQEVDCSNCNGTGKA